MKHVIRKQVIQLGIPGKIPAFELQQSVSDQYYKLMLPLIGEVFDDMSAEGETIYIDRLDIDLGPIPESDVTSGRLSGPTLAEMRDRLRVAIAAGAGSSVNSREASRFSVCRKWLYCMSRGYLPWNAGSITASWYRQVLEALAGDFSSVEALRRLIRDSPHALRRIVFQHDEEFLIALLEILTAQHQRQLPGALDEMEYLFPKTGTIVGRSRLWEEALWFATGSERMPADVLVASVLKEHLDTLTVPTDIMTGNDPRISIVLPALKALEAGVSLFPGQDKGRKPGEIDLQEVIGLEEIDEEGLFIPNAGQVLVHPFLPALFKRMGLVTEGKFVDNQSHEKALYVLHYIASGSATAEEYELVVPKLLCNWPVGMPVSRQVALTAEEMGAADGMLEALIAHWAALKTTSADGLREGFLCRQGKLYRKNEQMILQVEGKAIDVLLDQLPWVLGMIRLTWMKELLRVEWR